MRRHAGLILVLILGLASQVGAQSRSWPGGTTTDYVQIATSAHFNFNTNLCVMAMVYPTSTTGTRRILSVGAVSTRGFSYGLEIATQLFTKLEIANINSSSSTGLGTANRWYAIMASTSTGANTVFRRYDYTAGTLASETISETNAMIAPINDGGYIGVFIVPGESFQGYIHQVVVIQGTPTADEFLGWARTGRTPAWGTKKAIWQLRGNSPEGDLSGNAINGTVTGTSVVQLGPPIGLLTRP